RDAQFRFAPNETAKIFRVPLLNDDFVDGPKNFRVYIRSAVNNGTPGGPGLTDPREAPLVVTDDDAGGTIEFSSATYAVAEDAASGLAIITLSRSSGQAQVTVQARTIQPVAPVPFDLAQPIIDYGVVNTTVTFNAGDAIATFTVPIVRDLTADGVKTVKLEILNPQPTGFIASPKLGAQITADLQIVDAAQTVGFA